MRGLPPSRYQAAPEITAESGAWRTRGTRNGLRMRGRRRSLLAALRSLSMNPQRQWQFAGGVPENYERYLVPALFKPWAEDLVEMAALRSGDRVLDIACGTGIVARIAVRRLGSNGSVIGLDL